MTQAKSTGKREGKSALVRGALVEAACALLDEGASPTVTEAADRAGISRATAYRHFATNERLLTEAVLDRVAREMVALNLPQADTPEEAAAQLVDRVMDFVLANRELFRLMLRLSLEPGAGPRGRRRLGWARSVLEPHAAVLRAGALDDLVPMLALLLGPETLVALQDTAGQDDARSRELAMAAARGMVAAYRR
jgi:AcrR family transcriptional regulator